MPRKSKEDNKKYSKEYYKKNKIKIKKYNQKWWKEHPKLVKEYNLKKRFGITESIYQALLEKQDGVCAICGKKETQKHKSGVTLRLAVDHEHGSGIVRGLLCRLCNTNLSWYEKWKEQAEYYLKNS